MGKMGFGNYASVNDNYEDAEGRPRIGSWVRRCKGDTSSRRPLQVCMPWDLISPQQRAVAVVDAHLAYAEQEPK